MHHHRRGKHGAFGVATMTTLITMTGVVALAVAFVVAEAQAAPAGPAAGQGAGAGRGQAAAPPRGGGGPSGVGPDDKPIVDPAAADRGRRTYAENCINCHGTQARGTNSGPNLLRSLVIIHDRYGSELGPFLKKGHQMQAGASSTALTDAQVQDLAHFLRQRFNDTLRGSPIFTPQDILTGDAAAGAAYFNGPGKCTACHSVTGNLAGIADRYDPVTVQQRFLFPTGRGGGRGRGAAANPTAVTVTVTPASGPAVSGTLIQMDDFSVSLRDAAGAYRTFARTAGVNVVKTDPLTAHHAMLDTLTDKNIHDVVAYLETLK